MEYGPLDDANVTNENNRLRINKDKTDLYAAVDDDHHLLFANNSYASEKTEGYFQQTSKHVASSPFSIKDGYLNYKNSKKFYAVAEDNGYTLYTRAAGGDAVEIVLMVESIDGKEIPDFP